MFYDTEDLYEDVPYHIPEHEARHMKDHMIGLIEALYSTSKPIEDIENHLEEIAHVLGINIPKTPLRVKREKEKILDHLMYCSYKAQRESWLNPYEKPEHLMQEYFPNWKKLEERYQQEITSFEAFKAKQPKE